MFNKKEEKRSLFYRVEKLSDSIPLKNYFILQKNCFLTVKYTVSLLKLLKDNRKYRILLPNYLFNLVISFYFIAVIWNAAIFLCIELFCCW